MRNRSFVSKFIAYTLLIALAVVTLVPFFVTIMGAFREHTDIIIRGPLALPNEWNFQSFTKAIFEYNFDRYLVNTIIITVPTVFFSLVFGIMSSYALAFMEFPLKRVFTLATTVLGIMIAAVFIMIPLYQLMDTLNLIDTYLAAILPQVAMSSAFSTLVIRSFFLGLPKELLDSALVDGASSWQILWRILIPLSKPAIVTAGTLTTIWTWNSYVIPLVLLPNADKAPLPLGLVLFQGTYRTNIPLTMAGATITALPMIVFYLLSQRHIVKGLSQGAVD
ncbi:carbohydrate ABC transporter permease [Candidatus Bipolaricaulota bacterium]|nr:carbohydrate ABC transporter permease [Candidatus Bipolaricaulota bacterium]